MLAALLREHGGVVARSTALSVVPRHVVVYALKAGQIRTAYPGVLVAANLRDRPLNRFRAALLRAGPDAALSHTSALSIWGLPVPDGPVVHVMTGPRRRLRIAGVVAHRRQGFTAVPPEVLIRSGLPVTNLELSLVDAWPLAAGDTQRAPLLEAIRRRWTTADRMLAALNAGPHRLPGRAGLRMLLGKVATGCRSELELWGYDQIFTGPGMPPLERQVPVHIDGSTNYLDILHRPTGTNFELDGTKWHDGTSQRERDIQRDAALATLGIHAIRYGHDRLTLEPEAVRQQVLAILKRRATIIGR
jgi:hypothetical protein